MNTILNKFSSLIESECVQNILFTTFVSLLNLHNEDICLAQITNSIINYYILILWLHSILWCKVMTLLTYFVMVTSFLLFFFSISKKFLRFTKLFVISTSLDISLGVNLPTYEWPTNVVVVMKNTKISLQFILQHLLPIPLAV